MEQRKRFEAYLRGIETDYSVNVSPNFFRFEAYLRGIETRVFVTE